MLRVEKNSDKEAKGREIVREESSIEDDDPSTLRNLRSEEPRDIAEL